MVDTERQPLDTRFAEMLHILHAGGNFSYWWNRDPKTGKKASEWWKADKPTNPTNGVVDAYFGVHPTIEIPTTNRRGEWAEPENVRAQIPYIAAINALFGEYDAKDFDNDKAAALAFIEKIRPQPSAIVDSGGGYHGYWFLSETWQLDTADDRQRAIDIQARWVKFVGSDEASKDLARVLRVPGTHNLKYDDKPLVELVKFDPSIVYSLESLVMLLPHEEAPQPRAAIAPRVEIADKRLAAYVERAYRDELSSVVLSRDGEKHSTLRNAAVKIGSILHYGISEDEAFNALHDAIAGKAKDIKRADDTIRDGLEYGKADPRDLETHLSNTTTTPTTSPQKPAQQATDTVVRLWLSEDELDRIKLPRFIVDGVIVFGETTVIYGPSDAGKTFIVVDMVMRTAQHYPVMYVAGEDMPGVRLRKLAWQQHYQRQPNGNFRMWQHAFSLFDNEDVETFIQQNRYAGTKIIVFDTLSQCSIGADENSNTDMAIVMNNANRIAHEVDAAVIVIHHTTKQESSWRGAGAIKGNSYGFLSVEKPDESIRLECIRIKNSPVFPDRYFKLVDVVVDGMVDNKGKPISSCVIRPSKMVIRSERLSKAQHKILDAIGVLTKSQGKATSADAMAYVETKGNGFYKPLNVLLDKGYIEKYTGRGVGYCITETGRDYLIKVLHEGGNMPSDDDTTSELFTVNEIKTEVDNEVNNTISDKLTNELTQVDEPSQFRDVLGY
jgi:hypothetical protein